MERFLAASSDTAMLEQQGILPRSEPFSCPGSGLATDCSGMLPLPPVSCRGLLPGPPTARPVVVLVSPGTLAIDGFTDVGAVPLSTGALPDSPVEPSASELWASTTTSTGIVVGTSIDTTTGFLVVPPVVTVCSCEHHEQSSRKGLKASAYHFNASSKRQCVQRAEATARAGLKSDWGMTGAPGSR